ncbi:MAG: ribosome maturation factor RimP [Deltaproteobacteria bacterium]|nr:ribosome maturation factor RimP [Deltaproteobacteria bacterium]
MGAAQSVEDKVREIAAPIAASLGLELAGVEFTSGHGARILRVYIDKPGGVTVDDCSEVSRELSAALDVEDPIPQRYTLEVSSPGLDRLLFGEKDFIRFTGRKVRIKTKAPMEGRKNFHAVINGVGNGCVLVTDVDGKDCEIPLANIEKARLEVEL